MRALIVADGAPSSRAALDAAWPGWDVRVELVVAADGGARAAADLGLSIDAWTGDGDSLGAPEREALAEAGVPLLIAPTDKDESDTELAVGEAIRRGATDLTILGALGGERLDHALANVTLLASPALADRPARLLDPAARVSLLVGGTQRDRLEIDGRVGDLVTLLPLGGDAGGVTVGGLRYPLRHERLEAGSTRGLSNVRTAERARIRIDTGWLLVLETPATLAR